VNSSPVCLKSDLIFFCLLLSQVDPIVASFSGGAVGVISALMLVEVRNVRQQEKKRCMYCHGTGTSKLIFKYLFFARN
jgi:hypothetical protein